MVSIGYGHGNEEHSKEKTTTAMSLRPEKPTQNAGEGNMKKHTQKMSPEFRKLHRDHLTLLVSEYNQNLKPVLQEKCAVCHSSQPDPSLYPWYYSIPGVKHLMDSDVAEATEHMDFSQGFPFQSHGSVEEDLEALVKSTKANSMPPLKYKIMHWDSPLTEEEQQAVVVWAEKALEWLKTPSNPEVLSASN